MINFSLHFIILMLTSPKIKIHLKEHICVNGFKIHLLAFHFFIIYNPDFPKRGFQEIHNNLVVTVFST